MPKELLDIVDTAVKVGLGAIISGVATYTITRKGQQNEKTKDFRNKKVDILEYATENLDPFINALSHFFLRIDAYLSTQEQSTTITEKQFVEWKLGKYEDDLIATHHKRRIAISRLHLIGEDELIRAIDELICVEEAIRFRVCEDRISPDEDTFRGWFKKFKNATRNFYSVANSAFLREYS